MTGEEERGLCGRLFRERLSVRGISVPHHLSEKEITDRKVTHDVEYIEINFICEKTHDFKKNMRLAASHEEH